MMSCFKTLRVNVVMVDVIHEIEVDTLSQVIDINSHINLLFQLELVCQRDLLHFIITI